MPDNVEEWIIGDGVQEYKSLREIEKKLDHAMQRKRFDMHDSINRNAKRQKTMRIWISNTAENQSWQSNADEDTFSFENTYEGTWRVKIEGKLLDDEMDDKALEDSDEDEDEKIQDVEPPTARVPKKKFSHFFKGISLDFERSRNGLAGSSAQVEWKKQAAGADFDCIGFKRPGDENVNITINLTRDEEPDRYRLSNALSQTLDMEEAEKAEVVMGIWDYVRAMGLQEDEEKRSIRCDDRLRQVSTNTIHLDVTNSHRSSTDQVFSSQRYLI